MLSVVIPALNAADTVTATIESVTPVAGEIIVVDGGSTDSTVTVAESAGAKVLAGAAVRDVGRGGQLAAGGAQAQGGWILFLHADTTLTKAARDAIGEFTAAPRNLERAAAFRFALDEPGPAPAARRMERFVAWRSRTFALPYGDQGLLIPRGLYVELGGYRPIRLMEDVDLVRRIGRGRLELLDAPVVTSARRYREDGYAARPMRNFGCLMLYFLGVPANWIARLYAR